MSIDAFSNAILTELPEDTLGELLRDLTFTGDGIGCYSTFEVRDGAVQWIGESRRYFWRRLSLWHPSEIDGRSIDAAEMGEGYTYVLGPVMVNVCWFWDGDGTLAFDVKGNGVKRVLVNDDCKKDYTWREVRRERVSS